MTLPHHPRATNPTIRITLERMSQGGLHLDDLLADPTNDSTPVEAMRAIMTRGKEHGWTTSQLFGVFLEVREDCSHAVMFVIKQDVYVASHHTLSMYIIEMLTSGFAQLPRRRSILGVFPRRGVFQLLAHAASELSYVKLNSCSSCDNKDNFTIRAFTHQSGPPSRAGRQQGRKYSFRPLSDRTPFAGADHPRRRRTRNIQGNRRKEESMGWAGGDHVSFSCCIVCTYW